MPRPNEKVGDAAGISPEEIPLLTQELRDSFNADLTRPLSTRVSQLQALGRLFQEGRDELLGALKKDLHKSEFEGWVQEIALAEQEIYDAIAHIEEWTAPEYVNNGLLNTPGKSYVQRDPLGVCLIIGAWNYPILLQLQPLVGALAAGNTVMLKPGSYAENTAKTINNLVAKYMDPKIVKCVEGNRHVTSALLEQKWDMIFFTGSPYVGKIVAEAAAKNLTPVVLELGGKSPCIIDESADLYVSARRAIWGACMNAGQTCVRPDYFFVHENVADKFLDHATKAIKEFYGPDPRKTEWFGRLINDSAYTRLMKVVNDGQKYIVHGGANDASERYIEPTILDYKSDWDAFASSEAMNDELFGPIMPVIRYNSIDNQVIPFIRARPKPLALYCFASNTALENKVLTLTTSGGAIINDVVVHLSNPNLPFGGVGESGMGAYHGKRTFDSFTHPKAVVRKVTFGDAPQRYPPYSEMDKMVMKFILSPQVGYYYEKIIDALSDKKNLALAVMGACILRQLIKAKL